MKTDEQLQEELYELCKFRQRQWAQENGFTREYINKVCNGKKPMSEEIAEILGYEMTDAPWVKKKTKL